MKEFSHAIIALAAVMMMLSVAAIPASVSDTSDDRINVTGGLIDDMNNGIAMHVLVGMGTTWSWGSDILEILGFGKVSPPPAGSSDDIKDFAKEISMSNTADAISVLVGTSSILIDNNSQTWALAQAHLNRVAEISAGSMWESGATYDPARVLQGGAVYPVIANGMWNTSYALDYGLGELSNGMISYWSGQDWASGINTSIVWTGGSMPAGTSLTINLTPIVMADQDNGRVYLSSSTTAYGTITVWSDVGGTISSLDGVVQRSVAPGMNVIESLPDGFYTLSQGMWAGQFLPYAVTTDGQDHAAVTGGAVISDGASVAFVTVSDDTICIRSQTSESWNTVNSDSVKIRFSASGSVHDADISEIVRVYTSQIGTMHDCITRAAVAGQVMWTLSASAGSANIFLSPSSVSPDLTNLGFDANQSYALFVSALSQISAYYSSYGEVLSAGQVKISAESLDMYCHGTIHAIDGSVIAENAIFTPYSNIENMVVSRGNVTTFGASGTVMVWATGVPGLAGFDASSTDMHTAVVMPEGSYFIANEISYHGESVASVTLTVKEISRTDTLRSIVRSDVQSPKVLPADVLVAVIMIELAVILGMIGTTFFRSPVLIVVAVIVAILGFLIPETITRFLLEVFG